jgi:predicted nucleic acid-binding protein
MKNGVVIADSGPIISLALIDKLHILDSVFDEVKIANAVWEEITRDESKRFVGRIKEYFKDKKMISELKPIFEEFLHNKRFYALNLMNAILEKHNEEKINY